MAATVKVQLTVLEQDPKTVYICSKNCFLMDKEGSNTHGKGNSCNGHEKTNAPRGEVLREMLTYVMNSYFTLLPFNNFNGHVQCMSGIFFAKKLQPEWLLGIYVFSNNDGDMFESFGICKWHFGPSFITTERNTGIFTATPNVLMSSNLIYRLLQIHRQIVNADAKCRDQNQRTEDK